VDAHDIAQMTEIFKRIADAARVDAETAGQVREALAQSGLLEAFGAGETLDVVDLLDMGGEDVLRARLKQMQLSELRQIIAMRKYDPEKESARWRSPNKLIDLIVTRAGQQLEREVAAQTTSGASWML
jgi:hypothetical protein